MVKTLIVAFALLLGLYAWASGASARLLEAREQEWGHQIESGDLVFQDLDCGERCALIRSVTDSKYSHVGIVVENGGERMVWEALGPVGPVPLTDWVRRGIGGRVAVYRPIRALQRHHGAVELAMQRMAGRPYDGFYGWDDDTIYCSELVAKAYEQALGQPLVAPHTVDLGRHIRRIGRLSDGRLTPATLMVTPADLVRSGAFVRVVDELEGESDSHVDSVTP